MVEVVHRRWHQVAEAIQKQTAIGRGPEPGQYLVVVGSCLVIQLQELEIPGHAIEVEEQMLLDRTPACERQRAPEPEERQLVALGLLEVLAEPVGSAFLQSRLRDVVCLFVSGTLVGATKNPGRLVQDRGLCNRTDRKPSIRVLAYVRRNSGSAIVTSRDICQSSVAAPRASSQALSPASRSMVLQSRWISSMKVPLGNRLTQGSCRLSATGGWAPSLQRLAHSLPDARTCGMYRRYLPAGRNYRKELHSSPPYRIVGSYAGSSIELLNAFGRRQGQPMKWRSVLVATCLMSASMSHAQSQAQDVTALHRAVFELPASHSLPDADKAQALARVYAEGNGVPQDAVMACTLFDFGERARMNEGRGFEGLRLQQHAHELKAKYCDSLGVVERRQAFHALSCSVFGLARGTIVPLGPGWWLEFVGGDRVRIDFEGKEYEHSLGGGGFLCPSSQVTLFGTRCSSPPGPRAPHGTSSKLQHGVRDGKTTSPRAYSHGAPTK